MSEQEQTPREILQAWIGMGEFPSREEMSLVTLAKVREAIRAVLAEVERLRDIISPGNAAAYEEGMAALKADLATARSKWAQAGALLEASGALLEATQAERDTLLVTLSELRADRDGAEKTLAEFRGMYERSIEQHRQSTQESIRAEETQRSRADKAESALRAILHAEQWADVVAIIDAALRDTAPAEDPGLLKLAAQCAPAEERRGYAPTDAIGDARAEAAEPRCVRCGSRYSPGGACSRRAEGCQGGRGEWTTFFPPAEEPKP